MAILGMVISAVAARSVAILALAVLSMAYLLCLYDLHAHAHAMGALSVAILAMTRCASAGGRRVLHVRRDGVGPTYYAPTYYASTYYASTYSRCLYLLTMPLPPWLQSQPPNSTHYAHASPHYD